MVVTTVSPQVAAGAPAPAHASAAVRAAATGWRAWLELTKPKIVLLMLVTCVSGMVVADGGLPSLGTAITTLVGLALSIGGASALNHVLDRDLDRRMARTRRRPVASGTIGAGAATAFGVSLFAVGGGVLCTYVSPMTAWTALFGGAFYVLVYTPLKRVTVHNTVLGGVAGAMPPVVGWVAAGGALDSPLAWTLFAIMFLWQPAHFWPLSLLIQKDYAAAGFKMLPATHGERATVRATWRWTIVTAIATYVPVATGDAGWVYALGASVANVYLLRRMWALVSVDRARGADEATAAPLITAKGEPGNTAAT
ncbi:MAG: Cytochrome c oxidase assembly factor, CtaB, partial [Thermoleophilia bacterium]|nr:Cytochrome c oxidase assembly factor, CtaB [Thermoleophilia bacterium]